MFRPLGPLVNYRKGGGRTQGRGVVTGCFFFFLPGMVTNLPSLGVTAFFQESMNVFFPGK
jgi:hypothetical protein